MITLNSEIKLLLCYLSTNKFIHYIFLFFFLFITFIIIIIFFLLLFCVTALPSDRKLRSDSIPVHRWPLRSHSGAHMDPAKQDISSRIVDPPRRPLLPQPPEPPPPGTMAEHKLIG